MESESEPGPVSMKTKTLLHDLKSKYADKSWNGTVQLVVFFLKKTKGVCEPIAQCLQKINEALSVSFLTAVVSRLEMIAKQRGFELFLHTDIALRLQHPILFYALILDNHRSLNPALNYTFLLKLQPPLPMLMSFIEKMGNVTNGVIAEKPQQVEPLPQLLMKTSKTLSSKTSWTDGVQFVVPLPASEYHSYVFPGAVWGRESWKGALIHTVPFTHPSHVPASLDLLRHQSAINLLLASCFSNHSHHIDAGLLYDLRCEILPESDHCLSVTFSLADNIHLAVLQVTVVDSHQMSCRLLMPDFVDHKLDDYISRVLMRCMSIPITMRAIPVPGHIVHDLSCTCCMYFKEKKILVFIIH
uniref:Mediator of RNA polymerase II transcription subunit 1 n=1 Tax=Sinocyclocheilus rhinocerous TaxID=307959 RepID=A0A673GXZ8_9TELE